MTSGDGLSHFAPFLGRVPFLRLASISSKLWILETLLFPLTTLTSSSSMNFHSLSPDPYRPVTYPHGQEHKW